MANGIVTFFRNLFIPKGQSVIGIDIGSSAIKIVQMRKQGGAAILETYGEIALGPYGGVDVGRAVQLTPAKIAEALRDVLKEANATTRECAIAIPFRASLLSFIEMPNVDRKQLADMIPIEARKYVPVPMSEITLDWTVIPKSEENAEDDSKDESVALATAGGTTNLWDTAPEPTVRRLGTVNVLIVALHNEIVEQYRSVVSQLGLTAHFFELEVFSTVRSALDQGIEPVLIFDMGASLTKLYLVEHGIVKDSHMINRGAQDITLALAQSLSIAVSKAESIKQQYGLSYRVNDRPITEFLPLSLDMLFAEAKRMINRYQQKYRKVVAKVVLCGGGVILQGFHELAGKRLETDVVLAHPFGKLETPAFLDEMLRVAGPEFAVAIGIGLRHLQEQP